MCVDLCLVLCVDVCLELSAKDAVGVLELAWMRGHAACACKRSRAREMTCVRASGRACAHIGVGVRELTQRHSRI